MRDFCRFWWKCACAAARGNAAFANDWQWLFGLPIISGIAVFLANPEPLSMTGRPWLDAILVAFAAFLITWAVAFIIRFLKAPVEINRQEQARTQEAERKLAELTNILQPRIIFERLISARGGRGFDLVIRNVSGENLDNCIVKIESIDVESGDKVKAGFFPMVLVPKTLIGKTSTGTFTLRAGEPEPLSFVYRANMPSGWISIDHVGGPALFHGVKRCIMYLSAYSKSQPTFASVLVDITSEDLKAEILDRA